MELKNSQVNSQSIQSCFFFPFHAVPFQSSLMQPDSQFHWTNANHSPRYSFRLSSKIMPPTLYNIFITSIFPTFGTSFVIINVTDMNPYIMNPFTFLLVPCLKCIALIPLKVGMAMWLAAMNRVRKWLTIAELSLFCIEATEEAHVGKKLQ